MTAKGHGATVRRPAGGDSSKKKTSNADSKAARIARQKSVIRKIMARHPNALRQLAK